MAQLNDLMVMGQSTLLGPTKIDSIIDKNGSNGSTSSSTADKVLKSDDSGKLYWANDNNTTYLSFTGATPSANGSRGLVPRPLAGENEKFLRGDGKWVTVTDTKVTQTADTSTTNEVSVILCNVSSSGTDGTVTYCPSVKVKPSEGKLTATKFNAFSDIRLKENLVSFTPKKSILDLPIYTYDFINGAKNQIGCIAQDLQKICPEIVEEGDNGYLSIQESKIVYLLIDEIKKLKEEIKDLKEKE